MMLTFINYYVSGMVLSISNILLMHLIIRQVYEDFLISILHQRRLRHRVLKYFIQCPQWRVADPKGE